MRYIINAVDGDSSQSTINEFSQNMLARDCLALRQEIKRINNGSQDVFDNLPPICVDEKGEEINLSIYSKGIYFFDNDS